MSEQLHNPENGSEGAPQSYLEGFSKFKDKVISSALSANKKIAFLSLLGLGTVGCQGTVTFNTADFSHEGLVRAVNVGADALVDEGHILNEQEHARVANAAPGYYHEHDVNAGAAIGIQGDGHKIGDAYYNNTETTWATGDAAKQQRNQDEARLKDEQKHQDHNQPKNKK